MHVYFSELKLHNLLVVDGEAVSWLQECLHVVVSFAKDNNDTFYGIDNQFQSITPIVYFQLSSFSQFRYVMAFAAVSIQLNLTLSPPNLNDYNDTCNVGR